MNLPDKLDQFRKAVEAEARGRASDRMIAEAGGSGANGIVGVRFTTSTVRQGAAQWVACDTAVVTEDKAVKAS